MPAPPMVAPPAPPVVPDEPASEETGPVFFDEEPEPRPASSSSALPELRMRGEVAPAGWSATTWASDEDVSTSPVAAANRAGGQGAVVDPRGDFRRPAVGAVDDGQPVALPERSEPPGRAEQPEPADRHEPEESPQPNQPDQPNRPDGPDRREQTVGLRRAELPAGQSWTRQVRELAQQAEPAQAVVPAPRPESVEPGTGAASGAGRFQPPAIVPTQPARPVEPVQPVQPTQPARAVEPAHPVQPAHSVQPVQPTQAAAPRPAPVPTPAPWDRPAPADPLFAQTPEQAYPAGLFRRLLARVVDAVLPLAAAAAVAWPMVGGARAHIQDKIDAVELAGVTQRIWLVDGTTGGYLALVIGVFLLAGLVCEALPTALWGRTLGKSLCGVRVLDLSSQQTPSYPAAARRWLVFGVLAVLVVGVVNVLWCVRDRPWRQCWHDKAARTYVAR